MLHFFLPSGLQTVGIFRVGSSKKRVRQVRMSPVHVYSLRDSGGRSTYML